MRRAVLTALLLMAAARPLVACPIGWRYVPPPVTIFITPPELRWKPLPIGTFGHPADSEVASLGRYASGTMHRWRPKTEIPLQMRDYAWGVILLSGKMRLLTDGHADGVVLTPGS